METTTRRMCDAVNSRFQARRRLAREIAAYRTPAERLELDLILGRHTEEQSAEIDEILRLQEAAGRSTRHHALVVDRS